MNTITASLLAIVIVIAAVAVSRRMDGYPGPRVPYFAVVVTCVLWALGSALRWAWREAVTVPHLRRRVASRAAELIARLRLGG